MMIFAHLFFAFTIVMFGSDFAAMDGRMAGELDLPGSGIIPLIPWIALGLYVLAVLFTRKSDRVPIRSAGVVGGYLFAGLLVMYPNVLFDQLSTKIKTREFLPPEALEDFERIFDTPSVHYSSSSSGGPWIAVPNKSFDKAMVDWVEKFEKRNTE